MKRLLLSPRVGGYPTEYVLSRLRGRKGYLLGERERALHSDDPLEELLASKYREFMTLHSLEGARRRLSMELSWVYHQMNPSLRNIFWPFYLFVELRTMIMSIRFMAMNGGQDRVARLLPDSLLSQQARDTFIDKHDLSAVTSETEELLAPFSEYFSGLGETFKKNGLGGFEERLTDAYLQYVVEQKIHSEMKAFFRFLIDLRNALSLYKHLRWQMQTVCPVLVSGGTLKTGLLRDICTRGQIQEIEPIVLRLTGLSIENPLSPQIGALLLRGLSRWTKKREKESDVGFILGYLWRCTVEARNLSVILYGKEMNRDVIREEMMQ
jgi:hypothetical protein